MAKTRRSARPSLFPQKSHLALAVALSCGAQAVAATPTGEQVAAGLAEFLRQGGNLTVEQLTDRAVINWDNFSIAEGNITRFVQPSSSSAVLNRVISNNPSEIYGQLQSNGQVFLVNANGILVGQSGVINTHGFVASTLDIANDSFMAGGDLSFYGNTQAGIINQGVIQGVGGDVFLIATQIDNKGTIQAAGTAGLAAGSQVMLRESGHQRLWVGAAPVGVEGDATGIDNSGLISAAQAELQAAGGNMYSLAINNSGVVRANSVAHEGGRILLRAGSGSTVINRGTLDASSETGQGGHIEVTGSQVGLLDNARVDASGATGGGRVLIGGDYQGANPEVDNAQRTYVGADVRIHADATGQGDGGQVIVWADETTRFYGEISARGGVQGGDGGFAEVSGKTHLSYQGRTDLRADHGRTGALLLDPHNITIRDTGPDDMVPVDESGSALFEPGSDESVLTVQTLQEQLRTSHVRVYTGGADVGSQAGNITVDNAITWSDAYTLTLEADNNIAVNSNMTAIDGSLVLLAGGDVNFGNDVLIRLFSGDLSIDSNGSITQGTGSSLRIAGALDLVANGAIQLANNSNQFESLVSIANTGADAVQLSNNRSVTLGDVDVAGDFTVNAQGNITDEGVIQVGGVTRLTTTANNGFIHLDSDNQFLDAVYLETQGTGAARLLNVDGNLLLAGTNLGSGLEVTASGDITLGVQSAPVADGAIVSRSAETVTITSTGGNIAIDDAVRTHGGNLILIAEAGGIAGTANASLITSALVNTAVASGSVTLQAQDDIQLLANISTLGANNNIGVGSNAAAVTVTSTDGDVLLQQITTTGGNATSGATTNRNGGNAGNILVTAGADRVIELGGDFSAVGGSAVGASATGLGGFIQINSAAKLLGNRTLDTGSTSGDIELASTVDSADDDYYNLTLKAGDGNNYLSGSLGSQRHLGAIDIDGRSTFLGYTAPISIENKASNGTITFRSNVQLRQDATINRGTGALNFNRTVSSENTSNLNIVGGTGAGNVNFVGNISGVGNIRIEGITDLNMSSTVNAGSLTYHDADGNVVFGTGTATFSQGQTYNQAGGMQVHTDDAISLNRQVTTIANEAPVILESRTGSVSLNNDSAITTSNGLVHLKGIGVSQATNSTINSGTGRIVVDAGGSTISLLGSLTTSHNTDTSGDSAILLTNANAEDSTAINLARVSATNGTLQIGEQDLDGNPTVIGNVAQNSDSTRNITIKTLQLDVDGSVNFNSQHNTIGNLAETFLAAGNNLTVHAIGQSGGMNLLGNITAGNVDIRTGGGSLNLGDNNITSLSGNVHLQGVGLTQGAGSVVDAGNGTITIRGNHYREGSSSTRGAIDFSGDLITANTGTSAVEIYDSAAAALGNITTGAGGTVSLGTDTTDSSKRINGNVTQKAGTAISTNQLIAHSTGSITLEGDNRLNSLGAIYRGGNVSIRDIEGGLTLASGALALDASGFSLNNNVTLVTEGGALALGSHAITGNSITLRGDSVAGSGHIQGSTNSAHRIQVEGTTGSVSLGRLTTYELTGSAGTTAAFTASNSDVRRLGNFTTQGNFSLRQEQDQTLSLVGTVDAGAGEIRIVTSGGIEQTAGILRTTGSLAGSAFSGVNLDKANELGGLGPFNISGIGSFLLNDLGGLALTGNVTTNNGAITVATTGGVLDLASYGMTSGGTNTNISLSGRGIAQSNGSVVNASGGTIVINGHDGNQAGAIDMAGSVTTSNAGDNAIILRGGTTAALGTISALAGTVTIGQGGDITGAVTQSGSTVIETNILRVNVGDSALLTNNNAVGTLNTVTTGDDFALRDSSGLQVSGAVTSGGGIDIRTTSAPLVLNSHNLTANGDVILQGLGINQSSGSTINAGSGTIELVGLTGNIGMDGQFVTTSADDQAVFVRNANNVNLGRITAVNGGLVLGAAAGDRIMGALTQSNPWTARQLSGHTNSTVTLTQNNALDMLKDFTSGNNFTLNDNSGGLTVTGTLATAGTTSIQTVGGELALDDAEITVSGNHALTLTGVGVIQSNGGSITTAGATVNAGTGSILLDSEDNDFTSTVNLSASGAQVSIYDKNNLTLGSLGILGSATSIRAIAGGALTITSEAVARTGSGHIELRSLGGNLNTGGNLTTTSGNIQLAASGTVNLQHSLLSSTGNISVSGGSITHNIGTAGSPLALETGGAGTIQVTTTGASDFVMGTHYRYLANEGDITVTTGGNATLSTLQNSGDIAVTARGNISQAGNGAIVGDKLVATALNNGNIQLSNTGNSVGTASLRSRNAADSAIGSGALSYRNNRDLQIEHLETTAAANLTVSGSVTTAAGDSLIHADTLRVTTLHNSGRAIVLDNTGNSVNNINLRVRNADDSANANAAIRYTDANGYVVEGLETLGNATLSAGATVTQTAPIHVAGLALRGNGGFTLNTAGNGVGTLASEALGNVSLTSNGVLTIGTVDGVAGVTTGGANFSATAGSIITGGINTTAGDGATSGHITLESAHGITLGSDLISGGATGGDITLKGDVSLTGNRTIDAGQAGGSILLDGTVNGDHALTLNTGSGNVTFTGRIGGVNALQSLVVDAGGETRINGNAVSTTGAQTYHNAVVLNANTSLTASTVTLEGNVNGNAHNLLLDANAVLGADVGNSLTQLNALTVNGTSTINAGTITSTGSQTYRGAVSLNENLTITAGTADVGFGSTVNGANALTINSSGTTQFTGAVGSNTALSSLVTNAGGTTVINGGSVTTTGAQTYGNALSLGASTTLSGQGIGVAGTVGATDSFSLTINDSGDTVLSGAVGNQSNPLLNLTINSNAISLAGADLNGKLSLTANTGAISNSAALTVAGDAELEAASTISLNGALTVNGDLSLVSGGLISQSAPISVEGKTHIDTSAFATAGSVSLANSLTTLLAETLVGGNFTLEGSDLLVQVDGTTIRIAGAVNLNSAGVDLDDLAANIISLGTILGGSGIRGAGEIVLSMNGNTLEARIAGTLIGSVDLTASDDITVVSEAGGLIFSGPAMTDNAVLLTNAANQFVGEVSITTAAPDTALSPEVVTGISQDGALHINGRASFVAEASSQPGSGIINLSDAGNQFGSVYLRGRDVQLRQSNAMVIANASVTEVLALHAGDGITQTGTITAPSLLLTGTGNAVLNQSNKVGTLAANLAGNLSLTNAADLVVGQVAGTAGVTTTNSSVVLQTTEGDLVLDEAISVPGASTITLVAAENFINNAGANALVVDSGNWQVWSSNPADDELDGLTPNFKQYNANYGSSTVLGAGNGLFYTYAPTLSVSLTGTVSRAYDASTNATVGHDNYNISGIAGGDTVVLNTPAGEFNNRHVGTGKTVTVDGLQIVSATNGDIAVYGYQLGNTEASGNIGDISQATLTVDYTGVDKIYDGNSNALVLMDANILGSDDVSINWNAQFADRNVADGIVISVSGVTLSGEDAGNYVLASTTGSTSANITPATLTLTLDDLVRFYGQNNPELTYGFNGFVGSDDASAVTVVASTNALQSSGVGEYTITAAVSADNYTVNVVDGALTIEKAALTLTLDDLVRRYGQHNPALTYRFDGLVLNEDGSAISVDASTTAQQTSAVGTYNITALANAANYDVTVVDGVLTVDKALLTLTLDDLVRTYGANNPELTYQASGFVLGENVSTLDGFAISTHAQQNSIVGDYGITAIANSANYEITIVDGTLTVNPAPLVITFDQLSRLYGVTNPELSYRIDGFVLGEGEGVLRDFVQTSEAANASDFGHYRITGSASADNYTVSVVDGGLQINRAPLLVSIDSASRYYGSSAVSYFVTVVGLVNGETMAVINGDIQVENQTHAKTPAGIYLDALMPYGLSSNNYDITYQAGDLTILPVVGDGIVVIGDGDGREIAEHLNQIIAKILIDNERHYDVQPLYPFNRISSPTGALPVNFGYAPIEDERDNQQPGRGWLARASSFD